jgi:prepilin-type processing-associated H-X9-DG protein
MGNAIVINDAPRAFWLAGNLGDTLYLGMFRPNMIFQQPKTVHEALVGASSQHPGGVNVLLADGSARFVSDTISSWDHEQVRLLRFTFVTEQPKGIWQALHTRRDGDSTGDF